MRRRVRFRPTPEGKKASRVFSVVFVLVGLGFVFIGVTQLIPSGAGVFGIVWALVACLFVGIGIYGAVSKQGLYGMYGLEIEDEDSKGAAPEQRMVKLQALYDQRLITKEEYEAKRKEILKDL